MHRPAFAVLLTISLVAPVAADESYYDDIWDIGAEIPYGYVAEPTGYPGFDAAFKITMNGETRQTCVVAFLGLPQPDKTQAELNHWQRQPERVAELATIFAGTFEFETVTPYELPLDGIAGTEIIARDATDRPGIETRTFMAAVDTPAGMTLTVCESAEDLMAYSLPLFRQIRDSLTVPTQP